MSSILIVYLVGALVALGAFGAWGGSWPEEREMDWDSVVWSAIWPVMAAISWTAAFIWIGRFLWVRVIPNLVRIFRNP